MAGEPRPALRQRQPQNIPTSTARHSSHQPRGPRGTGLQAHRDQLITFHVSRLVGWWPRNWRHTRSQPVSAWRTKEARPSATEKALGRGHRSGTKGRACLQIVR